MNAARANTRKFRGIVLGHPTMCASSPHVWYRWKSGRQLTLSTASYLPREWMLAYVAWYEARGKRDEALALREKWLASSKKLALQSEAA